MDKLDCPSVSSLKQISQVEGSVKHGLKASEKSFDGFGEAYFSTVNFQMTKGWKLHYKMTLNLLVPSGEIRFLVHDGSTLNTQGFICPNVDIVLGATNYSRLTVPPNYWVAFQGVGEGQNILLNIANIEHDINEAINKPLDFFKVEGFNID